MDLHKTEGFPPLISTTDRKAGDNVTFSCQSPKDHRFTQWYKQSPGMMVQTMAAGVFDSVTQAEPFDNTRFYFLRENDKLSLTISAITKEDEATYFCQSGTEFVQTFIKGFLLVVNDYKYQKTVYVEQNPDTASTKPRDTLILQCSLFSTSNETRPQYPKNNLVHWFKAESGSSHPSIIYTASKSTDYAGKRSCVYHLSKTLEDSLDFGTYYCAVVLCGEILLGGGSTLEKKPDLPVLFLGGLLLCCVTVMVCLIIYILWRRVSEKSSGKNASLANAANGGSTPVHPKDLAREDANYAAVLELCATNRRQWKKMKENTECVYSIVRADSRKHSSSN
ncbi:uncharacterized protein LOC119777285 [Cyprinodon tularosa]|uniref:uncharacterized protein LOC119777285 n=1 Tax=Cyprinodon tularosa TaxID=77115 RepID=UPI0018E24493|nr:uncharacterized protein LOC119777285 [Cyprinodon tularosa]